MGPARVLERLLRTSKYFSLPRRADHCALLSCLLTGIRKQRRTEVMRPGLYIPHRQRHKYRAPEGVSRHFVLISLWLRRRGEHCVLCCFIPKRGITVLHQVVSHPGGWTTAFH